MIDAKLFSTAENKAGKGGRVEIILRPLRKNCSSFDGLDRRNGVKGGWLFVIGCGIILSP